MKLLRKLKSGFSFFGWRRIYYYRSASGKKPADQIADASDKERALQVGENLFIEKHAEEQHLTQNDAEVASDRIAEIDEEIESAKSERDKLNRWDQVGDPSKPPMTFDVKIGLVGQALLAFFTYLLGVHFVAIQRIESLGELAALDPFPHYITALLPVTLTAIVLKSAVSLCEKEKNKAIARGCVTALCAAAVGCQLVFLSDSIWQDQQARREQEWADEEVSDFGDDDGWGDTKTAKAVEELSSIQSFRARYGIVVSSVAEGSATTLLLLSMASTRKKYRRIKQVKNEEWYELDGRIKDSSGERKTWQKEFAGAEAKLAKFEAIRAGLKEDALQIFEQKQEQKGALKKLAGI